MNSSSYYAVLHEFASQFIRNHRKEQEEAEAMFLDAEFEACGISTYISFRGKVYVLRLVIEQEPPALSDEIEGEGHKPSSLPG